LDQLHKNPLARYPQEGQDPASNPHTLQRLVTADALDDAGLDSSLLRDLKQHVVVHDGQIKPGRLIRGIKTPLHHARTNMYSIIHQLTGDWPTVPLGTIRPSKNIHTLEEVISIEHPHEIGHRLASYFESVVPKEQQTDEFHKGLEQLRNAAYEEVDTDHPLGK
jgi:hypothetical protein